MARILIYDPDELFAARLYETLTSAGRHAVSAVPTVREACLVVAQQPHDLAFVPLQEAEAIILSLRRLQADLRVVVLTPDDGATVPTALGNLAQGVLRRSEAESLLSNTISSALQQTPASAAPTSSAGAPHRATLTAVLQMAIQSDQLLAVVLTARGDMRAHAGILDRSQAERVARRVTRSWNANDLHTAQLQFMSLTGRVNELLLYTQPVGREHLVTLVALPDIALSSLRRAGESLMGSLAEALSEDLRPGSPAGARLTMEALQAAADTGLNAFAIAWRPVADLPQALRLPLRRALERIAATNACVITYQNVQPSFVHLVVNCPPGRDSGWLAFQLKEGTEQEIRRQFGVEIELWKEGYVATRSTKPFSERELALFLSQTNIGE